MTHDPQTYLNAVEEFHRAFQYRYPTPREPSFDKDTITLRMKLLREETDELADATNQVEQLDALCDIQYVLSGAILALGMRKEFELAWVRSEGSYLTSFGCLIKWLELNLIAPLADPEAISYDFHFLQNALLDRVGELEFGDVFNEAFSAVHENNMGKLWTQDQVDAMHKNSPFTVTPSGTMFVVTRDDGKIMKPNSHTSVDLSRFVAP